MTEKKGTSGRGERHLHTRVKTARGRKLSSTLWLKRQLNDPYVKRAVADNLRARAAYKLIEIDDKFKLLKPGMRVVDLGCAPGGGRLFRQNALTRSVQRTTNLKDSFWASTCKRLRQSMVPR